MKRTCLLIGVLAMVLTACGDSVHPDVTAPRDAASVAAGAEVYAAACAVCHGPNLEGATAPGLVDHALGHPDSDYVEFVRDGKGDEMPAQGDTLSAEEIASVVDYVRSVQGAAQASG